MPAALDDLLLTLPSNALETSDRSDLDLYSSNIEGIVLEHMSVGEVKELRCVQQISESLKPQGLWLSRPGKWAEFCGVTTGPRILNYSRDMVGWFGQMRLDPQQIERRPWKEHGADRVAQLDLSDRGELEAFIMEFRADGYRYQVDWSRVSSCYGGVLIIGASSLYDRQPVYLEEFNQRDGCWILSIDVDSACLWDTRAMRSWLTHTRPQS